jgi:RNA polymerase sigma factor (sigma-70 family)
LHNQIINAILINERSMDQTDQDLIEACRGGSSHAWDQLLRKYERLVFSIPLNYGLSHDDSADIVQITFTILLQSLDNLHENSHLASWLATVARRHTWRIIEHGRRQSVGAQEDATELYAWLPDESSRHRLERYELVEWLHQGLAHLDERCAALLTALYLDLESEQASYSDVAARLGIPVGSIGPTRARCLERLKALLEQSE